MAQRTEWWLRYLMALSDALHQVLGDSWDCRDLVNLLATPVAQVYVGCHVEIITKHRCW